MITQLEQAQHLHDLHKKGDPLILINVWDAGSAQAVQEIGAKVIATGSWSVAAAHGYEDGEKLPFDLVLANLKRISEGVKLPVTIDMEGGYGQYPAQVLESVLKVIEAGAVGINIEDQTKNGVGLNTIEDQCMRIAAAHKAAEQTAIPLFINVRTDIFLQIDPNHHNDSHVEKALQRAHAYAAAGANGFFAPGLSEAKHIESLCKLSPLPVNIMITPRTPAPRQLAELGVARISYGPHPYLHLMSTLKAVSIKALAMDFDEALDPTRYFF
ncbi:isocitrate lyase/phosphoenolpyruvate mutase family protein [Paenibacillus sp. N3.4]|uniref:isocitrate lyase/PEP mutase family protein n=1 Tax=Paenibacillus sp. N3.4 TaxID=2603222 RepID=UPI0011CA263D|nr:isocitrate lyase/phosphoenolpyruvate mutase family protein [Paenibacillus sp. N3.4]TXK80378.1 isocitrate lyase/phosphoenolpyruvate mutase family protein [Paenibacillus sp. N3.4]